jgi:hypothetical protein
MVAVNTAYTGETLDLDSLDELTDDNATSTSTVGWYFELGSNEYPTTPPVLYNGYLFFSTFESNDDPCVVGDSKIYVINSRDGSGAWEDGSGNKLKSISIPGAKVSGITISDNTVFMGITDFSGHVDENLPSQMLNVSTEGNVLIFDVPTEVGSSGFPIDSGNMVPHYWREWIR